jgi:hypothetical protein
LFSYFFCPTVTISIRHTSHIHHVSLTHAFHFSHFISLHHKGNVILMRSRFEDATAAHRLLLSPIDAIDSHFRSGYGMVATILRRYSTTQARLTAG